MTRLGVYNINAMATNISREFFITETEDDDKSYVLEDEMSLRATDIMSRLNFISKVKT